MLTRAANVAQSEEDVNQQNISRISVERLNIRYWNIIIREVRINDSGAYICQINTKPILIKQIHLLIKGLSGVPGKTLLARNGNHMLLGTEIEHKLLR
ncbi:hypothetical protein DPMN_055999 [Dreissena polymorpha]|uniref:Uncharacterized protein n=1 Tax=Dreissena polymorpha TaxID=45954 RepID=A0A9D4CSE2_DREPO|nr:hypothetical protein DPMN_055999 [Dreissena polymorpha]